MIDFVIGDYVRISVTRTDSPVEGEIIAIVEPGEEMLWDYRDNTKNSPRVAVTAYRRYVVKAARNKLYVSRMVTRATRPPLPEPPKPVAYRHIKTLRRIS